MASPPAQAAAVMTITEYPLLSPTPFGSHLTVGPDGNAWAGLRSANKVAKVTPEGVVTEYTVPTQSSFPNYLTPGPDGNVWFTEGEGLKIARITPTGDITEFPIPSGNEPGDITLGPDGNFWFTLNDAGKVGRMTPTGTVTEFTPPTVLGGPSGVTVGSDGNLWVSLREANKIARLTTAGVFTEFTIPTIDSDTDGVKLGPDGNVWFGEVGGNKIGKITPSGAITEYQIPTIDAGVSHLAPGPDGNMWFAETNSHKIGRITPTGTVTEFPLPTTPSGPHMVAFDSASGLMWVTERDSAKVAKVQIPLDLTVGLEGGPTGTVTSDPEGINCGTDCTDTFLSGSTVLLTALPPPEGAFEWGGDCSGTEKDCEVTMNGPKDVTAEFGAGSFNLRVTKIGKGKVTSSPAGINCGSDCSQKYPTHSEITLTKKPKAGWKFVKWTGDCTGKNACVLTMDSDMAVTAKFKKKN